MIRFVRQIQARNTDEGASAVEYGLLVAAIAAIIVLLVFAVGKFVKAGFKETCDGIKSGASTNVAAASNCPS